MNIDKTERPSARRVSSAANGRLRPNTSAEDDASDPLYVTALARGLSILKCCGESEVDLSVTEIAKRLAVPQSTVWRSCYTMLKLGYLVRVDQDRLRPGLSLLGLGHAALSRHPLAELARPEMEKIAARLRASVSLGVRDGFEMLYIERVDYGPVIYPGLRKGSRISVLSSAMGWAYVAALAEPQREKLLSQLKLKTKDQYQRTAGPLTEAVKYYQSHGFIVNSGIIHPELNAVGVPVGLAPQAPVASLGFGGLKAEFPMRRLLNEVAPLLRGLARELSQVSWG